MWTASFLRIRKAMKELGRIVSSGESCAQIGRIREARRLHSMARHYKDHVYSKLEAEFGHGAAKRWDRKAENIIAHLDARLSVWNR